MSQLGIEWVCWKHQPSPLVTCQILTIFPNLDMFQAPVQTDIFFWRWQWVLPPPNSVPPYSSLWPTPRFGLLLSSLYQLPTSSLSPHWSPEILLKCISDLICPWLKPSHGSSLTWNQSRFFGSLPGGHLVTTWCSPHPPHNCTLGATEHAVTSSATQESTPPRESSRPLHYKVRKPCPPLSSYCNVNSNPRPSITQTDSFSCVLISS